jgi:hypothetical protein
MIYYHQDRGDAYSCATRSPSTSTCPCGRFRPDGPTAGSVAVEGSGGGYLSNEWPTATRCCSPWDVPDLARTANPPRGGHVHTPTLGSPANPADITDPGFEQQRSAIVGQVRAIVARAVT